MQGECIEMSIDRFEKEKSALHGLKFKVEECFSPDVFVRKWQEMHRNNVTRFYIENKNEIWYSCQF